MRKLIIRNLITLILTTLLIISCNSDDCNNDEDTVVLFPVQFKLSSTDGQNLLTDNDFDISLLNIIDIYFPSFQTEFTIIESDNEMVIELQYAAASRLRFEYNNEMKFELVISDVKKEFVDCLPNATAFTATTNGELICECSINDVVNITFNI